MQKTALRISGLIFFIIALLHFARAFWCVAIFVGGTVIPLYLSWIGGVVCLALAVWMFVASKK